MADNTQLNSGTGGNTFRTLEDGSSIQWPVGVTAYAGTIGTPDVLNIVTLTDGLPVQPMTGSTWAAAQSGTWNIGTVTAVTAISNALPAGTNAIGKLAANSGVDIGDVDITSIIPGTGATNLGKAVDTATGATDTGVLALATRDDALSALTPIEGDNVQLRTDANGALWVIPSGTVTISGNVTNAGTFAVQAAQSGTWNITNVSGTVSLPTGAATAAKQPALGTAGTASADVITVQGIASMTALKVDGSAVTQPVSGTFWQATQPVSVASIPSHDVTNAGTFAVQATLAAGATNIAKAEDVASANADVGVPAMAVQKATPANTAGTDGDYEFLQMSAGRLWTSATIDAALPAGTNAIGKLAANTGVDIGDVDVTSIIPGTGATNLGKAIDTATGATDTGVLLLATRDDALSALTPIEGDNVQLRTDANGALWTTVSGTVTVGSHAVTNAGTFAVQVDGAALTSLQLLDDAIYVDDVPFTAGSNKVMAVGFRYDDAAPGSLTEGDVGYARVSARREQYVQIRDAAGNERGLNIDASGNLTANITGTVTVGSHAVTNAGTFVVQENGAALTALQLIDDIIYTDDTSTHATGTSKGALIMAAAAPTDTAVNANDIGAVGMTVNRGLYVSVQDALPAGTNGIGKLTANSGVTIGAVEIAAAQTLATVTTVSTVTTCSTVSTLTGGGVAHDSADSGNPVKVGARAIATPSTATMVAAADRSDLLTDLDGALLVRAGPAYGDLLSERVTDTGGTSTAFTNFAATASARNYITAITVFNSSATAGYIDFRDGAAGSILYTVPIPAGGGSVVTLGGAPLFRTTANTALAYDVSAALTTVYISVSGFKSKV